MFDWVAFWKYAGVVGTLIGSGFGLPIPEEIPVVTGGAMVGHDSQAVQAVRYADSLGGLSGSAVGGFFRHDVLDGRTRWYVMLPLIILGVVIGDSVLYGAGRLFGNRLLHSRFVTRRILPPEKRAKIEENFNDRGVMILLGARFTPGIRTPVFIMSGVLKMPFTRFLLADALYAVPGVNVMFWLAYLFTDQFVAAVENVEDKVQRYRPLVVVAVVAAALGILLYRFLTTRTLSTGDPEKIPTYAKPVGAAAYVVEQAVEQAVEKTKDVIDKVAHPLHRPHEDKDKPTEPHPAKPTEEAKKEAG